MVYILDLFFLPQRCNNTHLKPLQTRQLDNENKKTAQCLSGKPRWKRIRPWGKSLVMVFFMV